MRIKGVSRLAAAWMFTVYLMCGQQIQAQTTAQTNFSFPQIAVGQNGDGTQYFTYVVLTNPSTSAASGNFALYGDSGAPVAFAISNAVTGTSVSAATQFFSLPAGTTSAWEIASSGPVTSGWAIVNTAVSGGGNGVAIGGTAIYQLSTNNTSGTNNNGGSAGVGGVGFVNQFVNPTLTGSENRTGVAVGSVSANTLTFKLLDSSGTTVATAQRTLPALGHVALFVDELFPGKISATFALGTLQVAGTSPMSGVVIEYFGQLLTTFPTIVPN